MWPPPVVVLGVHGKHVAQVSLSEDQHAVGELGPYGQDEAFGEAVRPRTPRRDLHHLTTSMPASARTASNEAVNWPARSRTRNRNRAASWPRSMRRLRACCVV